MDRHAAARRLKQLADTAGIRIPRMHPHILRHSQQLARADEVHSDSASACQ
jgi:site-specific recombinase XerD